METLLTLIVSLLGSFNSEPVQSTYIHVTPVRSEVVDCDTIPEGLMELHEYKAKCE